MCCALFFLTNQKIPKAKAESPTIAPMTIPAMAPPEILPPWSLSVGIGVELLIVGVGVAVDRSSARQLICILWDYGETFMRGDKYSTAAQTGTGLHPDHFLESHTREPRLLMRR